MRPLRNLMMFCLALAWTGCVAGDDEHAEHEVELLEQVAARDAGRGAVDGGARGATDGGARGALGTTCSVDTDCAGTGARCLTEVLSLSIPGGFCTATCKTDRQCGTGAGCPFAAMIDLARKFLPDAGLTDNLSICMKKCAAASDCRAGYACAAMPAVPLVPTNSQKYCMPPMPDGGLPRPDGGVPGLPRNP